MCQKIKKQVNKLQPQNEKKRDSLGAPQPSYLQIIIKRSSLQQHPKKDVLITEELGEYDIRFLITNNPRWGILQQHRPERKVLLRSDSTTNNS